MFHLEGGWNISFAGCGFLGVYHIGVASTIQEHAPYLTRDANRIYGASAGALTAAAVVCGVPLDSCCADVMKVAKEARKRNLGPLHPSFNLVKILKNGLFRSLPENAHQLATGRLCISLTRVPDGENVLVSEFNSKEELIQALICSAFVPIYCGLIPPSFRGVVLGEMCHQGYEDALRFLKGNNLLKMPVLTGDLTSVTSVREIDRSVKQNQDDCSGKSLEQGEVAMVTNPALAPKSKSNNQQLRKNHWSSALDEKMENLPPRLCNALHEACKETSGLYAQLGNLFLVRMASYAMLPYTLPLQSAYSFGCRLVEWLPDVPQDVCWMREQLNLISGVIYHRAAKQFWLRPRSRVLPNIRLRKCLSLPPISNLHQPCVTSQISSLELNSQHLGLKELGNSTVHESDTFTKKGLLT
ncbi:patatin-like phospholipase domain containing 3 isoform X3 [Stegostoma tigrinum]|uniref:patatin-like phospholipase domain containing 3 isoform X3 n=1 Tax=Stegostoma tigrinum TaxID=3053191 RepID=UPI002870A9A6|nr:patatin-like phospholipase domain containing 3 isoform X3 [Stegostoma tigrinum]